MEHLDVINVTAAGTYLYPIPKGGQILGIYSSAPITIAYNDNGTVGTLKTAVNEWEPRTPFMPAPTSFLNLVTTGAASISVRFRV